MIGPGRCVTMLLPMKCSISASTGLSAVLRLLFILCLVPLALGGEAFQTWRDLLGRSFEAKVVSVGVRTVKLENREGQQIDFPLSDLMPSSREQVNAWLKAHQETKAAAVDAGAGADTYPASAFDSILNGKLERLSGKRLKRCTDATRPQKYYLFYYTASWCPPCRKFTPTLVNWYQQNKNDNFELVLITFDRSEEAMAAYASDKKMPWPQLQFEQVKDFKQQFKHGVTGIPSLIVCELDGKVLGNYRGSLDQLSQMVK